MLVGFKDSDTSKFEGVCNAVFIAIVQKVRQMFSVVTETLVQTVLFQINLNKYHQRSTKSRVFSKRKRICSDNS